MGEIGERMERGGSLLELGYDERFRLLVQSVTDYAIFMLDPEGVVVSWNAGAQRFKGYEADEIIGQNFARFYTEEDRAADLPRRVLRTAAEEGRFEAEGWRVRKDGSRFWASVVIDPILDDGKLIGFAKITRDLTDRRAAADALRRSEERFRLLVQNVTDYAIYMLDPDGRVTNWNAGAQRIKGYRPGEIIGEHFSRFYTEEDRAAGLPQLGLETARREGRFEKEGWRVRKDGSRFFANVVIDAIHDDDGKLIGFAKITRDITERIEAQQALEKAREAFFQSQKMEAVGQLTGGVAHDFNNLLSAILGSLDLAQRRLAQGADPARFINNAIMAAERGAALTQRMLTFARRQELRLEAIDLSRLVRDMAELLERTLGTGVRVETRFPLLLKPVRGDQTQLELALLNLAVNARDAMPEGGRITIAAEARRLGVGNGQDLAPGHYVCLSVRDEGHGMDEDTLKRATEPFFTTKGVGKGTGLGLSMVHGMAEQCGGRLILKSREGEGTTAELWLPVAGTAEMEREDDEPAEGMPVATDRLVILTVDDDQLVLMNTTAMLEDLGHRVLEATSGRQALDLLADNAVDLVITDYLMPQMTGVQLAEAVDAGWPGVPVLLATGYAELPPGIGTTLPRLAKPFREDQLARAVSELAGTRRAPARKRSAVAAG
jgi:PAS domain S-box-containing protein